MSMKRSCGRQSNEFHGQISPSCSLSGEPRVEELFAHADTSPIPAGETAEVNPREYRGRIWVTQPRPGIDRFSFGLADSTLTRRRDSLLLQKSMFPAKQFPLTCFTAGSVIVARTARSERFKSRLAFGITR